MRIKQNKGYKMVLVIMTSEYGEPTRTVCPKAEIEKDKNCSWAKMFPSIAEEVALEEEMAKYLFGTEEKAEIETKAKEEGKNE